LKICKSKKYKHSTGNGSQKVAKFVLPKECHILYYQEAKKDLDNKIKDIQKKNEPKEVKLIDT
jgi:hypothetical protein